MRAILHRRISVVLSVVLAAVALAIGPAGAARPSHATSGSRPDKLRLGLFPNLTHAPALVGVERGFFANALGPGVKLRTYTFAAGPTAVEALFSGAIDAAYIGPGPAVTAWVRSKGKAIRIVAGSTSGGAFLVVRPGIDSAADLRGATLATPQLGGTQDVALRHWLRTNGMRTTLEGGGDVSIVPQENSQTLETMRSGGIDGAWVPEPWATRLVTEAGARVLVDERDLWPRHSFTTTVLVVRTRFLEDHPAVVEALLRGHTEAVAFTVARPAMARDAANRQIAKLTGKRLPASVINRAWANLTFTNDPGIATIRAGARHAADLGIIDAADLDGIEDLTLLKRVLARADGRRVDG